MSPILEEQAVLPQTDFFPVPAPAQFLQGPNMKLLNVEKSGTPVFATEYRVLKSQGQGLVSAFLSVLDLSVSNTILRNTLRNTLKMYRFSEEYSALLQEHISPEAYSEAMLAFRDRTTPYARAPRDLSPEEMAREAKVVLDAVDEELGSDELADMLNLDVFALEAALTRYSKGRDDATD